MPTLACVRFHSENPVDPWTGGVHKDPAFLFMFAACRSEPDPVAAFHPHRRDELHMLLDVGAQGSG